MAILASGSESPGPREDQGVDPQPRAYEKCPDPGSPEPGLGFCRPSLCFNQSVTCGSFARFPCSEQSPFLTPHVNPRIYLLGVSAGD